MLCRSASGVAIEHEQARAVSGQIEALPAPALLRIPVDERGDSTEALGGRVLRHERGDTPQHREKQSAIRIDWGSNKSGDRKLNARQQSAAVCVHGAELPPK